MESNVLLCCLKPSNSSSPVNATSLREFFTQVGPVKALSIFSNKVLVKFFLEFEGPLHKLYAIDQLNNRTLPIGHLRIFQSRKPFIISSNEPSLDKPADDPP